MICSESPMQQIPNIIAIFIQALAIQTTVFGNEKHFARCKVQNMIISLRTDIITASKYQLTIQKNIYSVTTTDVILSRKELM